MNRSDAWRERPQRPPQEEPSPAPECRHDETQHDDGLPPFVPPSPPPIWPRVFPGL
jgi:hypothetical protein